MEPLTLSEMRDSLISLCGTAPTHIYVGNRRNFDLYKEEAEKLGLTIVLDINLSPGVTYNLGPRMELKQ
jgi:saccharopine dehydrogenase-like NADP-dependent oxidoreductase